jgi:E3 ubiquitin-protein ligase MARCH5
VIEVYDNFLTRASPFAAAAAVFGSVYCSACVYGAVTVMQVLGQDEGKQAIETADPLMLIVGLPSIPVLLVCGKLIRWEDSILKLWKRHCHKIPIIRTVLGVPPEVPRESAEKILLGRDNFTDPLSATRMFCGALVLPTMAMVIGKYMFSDVNSNLKRTLFGGLTFLIAKGILKIYLRQQQYIRHARRTVSDYNDAVESDPKTSRNNLLVALNEAANADEADDIDHEEINILAN